MAKQENGLAPTTQCYNAQFCVVGQSRFLKSPKIDKIYYMERHLKISEKAKPFSKIFFNEARSTPFRSQRIFSDFFLIIF